MRYLFDTEHQFKYLCEYLADNNSHYGSRFNYASCELWLCQEACQIINFGSRNYHLNTEIPFFCYNEDNKRDLSFYTFDGQNYSTLISHIEVKLIYPTYNSKKSNKIKELYNKLVINNNDNITTAAWVFLVWTDYYEAKEDCEQFFSSSLSLIESYNDISINKHNDQKILSVIDTTIPWRGTNKRIVVKALSFTH